MVYIYDKIIGLRVRHMFAELLRQQFVIRDKIGKKHVSSCYMNNDKTSSVFFVIFSRSELG